MREQESVSDHQEVEWQFDALDLEPVSRWLDGYAGEEPSVSPGETREITDTYHDTDDWRVYRAGYALRVRRKKGSEAEITMKLLAPAKESGVKRRQEISCPLDGLDLGHPSKDSGPVGERLYYLAGPKALKSIFEVRTRRSTYTLGFNGTPAGEVDLDETTIPAEDEQEPVGFGRVEVEVDPNAFSRFEPFVGELREGCGLSPATRSKYLEGLATRGLEPAGLPDLGPTDVDASLTLNEVAFAVLREQFGSFLSHESGVRLGEDPKELHDMRVAGRRMRAAMRVFADALPARLRELENELRWITRALGDMRDLDVQLQLLEGWTSAAPLEDREPLALLGTVLEGRREKARSRMLRVLNSHRYASFVESFTALLQGAPYRRSKAARQPILEAGPDLIRKRYRKVRKVGDELTESSAPEDYHKLRKRSKKLRYALDFLSNVYGKPVKKTVASLKALQDVLGDHQDAVVAGSYLRELSVAQGRSRRLPPPTVFAMGGFARRCDEQAQEQRRRFPKAYGKIKGKRWKKLERAMKDARPEVEGE